MSSGKQHYAEEDGAPSPEKAQDLNAESIGNGNSDTVDGSEFRALKEQFDCMKRSQEELKDAKEKFDLMAKEQREREELLEEKLSRIEEAHDELRALIGEEKRNLVDRIGEEKRNLVDRIGEEKRNLVDRIGEEKRNLVDRMDDKERNLVDRMDDKERNLVDRMDDKERNLVDRMEEKQEEMKEFVAQQAERGVPRSLRGSTFVLSRVASALALSNTDKGSLEGDTFSIMMVSKVYTQGWVLGLVILGVMIAVDQGVTSPGSSLFNVPFRITPFVNIGQILSIFLCLATQNDILVPIRNFVLLGERSNWDEVIGEDGNRSTQLWWIRIALPNLMKSSTGMLVTFVSFVIIVQADNIIDLLKDFTALMIISEVDNILFQLAAHGYLGDELCAKTETVEGADVTTTSSNELVNTRRRNTGILYVRLVFLLLLAGMFGGWGVIVASQRRGIFFKQKFPGCDHFDQVRKFGDEKCYGGPLNTLECKFENGDCASFNEAYPLCKGDHLIDVQNEVGNGTCNELFATEECDFDGGDCCPYDITNSPHFGDGQCDAGKISTKNCGYDHGDCNDFVRQFPKCPLDDIAEIEGSSEIVLGNGICDGVAYASELCGREDGDCDVGQLGQDIIFRGVASDSSLEFESRMSAYGSTLMIGMYKTDVGDVFNTTSTGQVRLFGYNHTSKLWSKIAKDLLGKYPKDLFGFGVAMNHDGSKIAVGSPVGEGKVNVYHFRQNRWEQLGQTLQEPPNAMSGYRVAMTMEGSRIAFSSILYEFNNQGYTGKVQVFEMNPSKQLWEQVGHEAIHGKHSEVIGYFHLSFDSSGSRIYFSARYFEPAKVVVRVYEYKILDNEWVQLGMDIPNPHPHLTQRPAVSADGNRIAIGSYTNKDSERHGQVEVFDLDISNGNITWTQVGPTLTAKDKKKSDGFGYNIDMNADGTLLAIGALDPNCLGNPVWCPTGSIQLYRFNARNPPNRLFSQVPFKLSGDAPNVMREIEREIDHSIFGKDMSLSGDGSKIFVSGFDSSRQNGFVKVYEVDDLFYPECIVPEPDTIGNGGCSNFEPYYTKECSYDGGDCPEPSKVEGYSNCYVMEAELVGNGKCNDYFPNNSKDCGYDGGDCSEPVEVNGFPGCFVLYPNHIGNGDCLGFPPYDSYECGFEGGDCLPVEYKS